MLFLDVYQDPQGNIKTQYVPNTPKDIKPLRDCLRLLEVQNPLCLFAYRQENGYYDKLTEDETQRDAWVADTLSAFWKKTDDDPGQPRMNAFSVLTRMTDAYLAEHEELLELREKVHRSSRKRQTRSSHKKKPTDDITDVFTADPSFETEDEDIEFIDFLSYGAGLQAQRYSEYLTKHKNVDNSLSAGNGDYYNISDFGIVTYAISEEYRQVVNIYFYDTNKQYEYPVSITVDTIADEKFIETKALFEYLSKDRKISIPYSNLMNIELKVEAIEGPCQVLSGVRLSYELDITAPEDGINEVTMLKIYNITTAMQKHIRNAFRITK